MHLQNWIDHETLLLAMSIATDKWSGVKCNNAQCVHYIKLVAFVQYNERIVHLLYKTLHFDGELIR